MHQHTKPDATAFPSSIRQDQKESIMKTICFVVCYFGKWPRWFNYYLKSCEANSTINWILYTDCPLPKYQPDNVQFITGDLESLKQKAIATLGCSVVLDKPYNACDLKPVYGVLFKEELKNYDFWGYTDIDLIYGNLRYFLTDDILNSNHVLGAGNKYLVGHFTLFRNQYDINRLYLETEYQKVFRSHKYHNFDEANFRFEQDFLNPVTDSRSTHTEKSFFGKNNIRKQIFAWLKFPRKKKTFPVCKSITEIVIDEHKKGNLTYTMLDICKADIIGCSIGEKGNFIPELVHNWSYKWDKGRLLEAKSGEETFYFHFQRAKKQDSFKVAEKQPGDSFSLTPDGIT